VLAVQVLRLGNRAGTATSPANRSANPSLDSAPRNSAACLRRSRPSALSNRVIQGTAAVKALWEHSRAVAQLASEWRWFPARRILIRLSGGLLHDLGKSVVATILLEAEARSCKRNPSCGLISQPGFPWSSAVTEPLSSIWRASGTPREIQKAIQGAPTMIRQPAVDRECRALRNAVAKQQGIYAGPVKAEESDAFGDGRALAPRHRRRNADRLSSDLKERARSGVAR